MTWYSGDDAVVEHKIQVLKEAEHAGTATSSRLGKVGSHIIGEVILGGIKWARESVLNEPGWTSTITNSRRQAARSR